MDVFSNGLESQVNLRNSEPLQLSSDRRCPFHFLGHLTTSAILVDEFVKSPLELLAALSLLNELHLVRRFSLGLLHSCVLFNGVTHDVPDVLMLSRLGRAL